MIAYHGKTPIIGGPVARIRSAAESKVCGGLVGGHRFATGAVPRDFTVQPRPMTAVVFPLIPLSEYSERIRDKVAAKSQLSDLRNRADNGKPFASLDQDGQGFCWAYSVTVANMLARLVAGLPYERLSAHSVAWVIKNGRDEGGWCGLSMQYVQQKGVMPVSLWPEKSMNGRQYNTAENWAKAQAYVVTEGWVDLDAEVYDQNLSDEQVDTLCLSNIPGAEDHNWWGHSIGWLDVVDGVSLRAEVRDDAGKLLQLKDFDALWGIDTGVGAGYGRRILNSWTDQWEDNGTAILTGAKKRPDGAVAVTTPNM